MAPREPSVLLADVVSAANEIVSYTEGLDLKTFVNDRLRRSAVERQLMIVGEAVVQLRKISPEVADMLGPAREIAGFRNIIVHAYFAIDPARIWDIVVTHLPDLHDKAAKMLEDLGPPPGVV